MDLRELLDDPGLIRGVATAAREHRRIPPFAGWPQSCGGFGCDWVDGSAEQHPIHFDEHVVRVTIEALAERAP